MEKKQGIAILTPQFSVGAVLRAVSLLKAGTLQAWLNRKLVTTIKPDDLGTGTGNARMLSAANVVQLASMAHLSNVGVPLDTAAQYGEMAVERLVNKAINSPMFRGMKGLMLHIWADEAGEWQHFISFEGDVDQHGKPDTHERPYAFIVFAVDELIGMVAGKLTELVEEREQLRRSQRFPAGQALIESFKPLAKSGKRDAVQAPA